MNMKYVINEDIGTYKQGFKGDFQAEFKKIEKERLSLMKESILFTAFTKQE